MCVCAHTFHFRANSNQSNAKYKSLHTENRRNHYHSRDEWQIICLDQLCQCSRPHHITLYTTFCASCFSCTRKFEHSLEMGATELMETVAITTAMATDLFWLVKVCMHKYMVFTILYAWNTLRTKLSFLAMCRIPRMEIILNGWTFVSIRNKWRSAKLHYRKFVNRVRMFECLFHA